LELQRTNWKRNTEKDPDEKREKRELKQWEDLDGHQGNSWKESSLAMLCGGFVFRRGATGIDLTIASQTVIIRTYI
jgi:hypothetical protein